MPLKSTSQKYLSKVPLKSTSQKYLSKVPLKSTSQKWLSKFLLSNTANPIPTCGRVQVEEGWWSKAGAWLPPGVGGGQAGWPPSPPGTGWPAPAAGYPTWIQGRVYHSRIPTGGKFVCFLTHRFVTFVRWYFHVSQFDLNFLVPWPSKQQQFSVPRQIRYKAFLALYCSSTVVNLSQTRNS